MSNKIYYLNGKWWTYGPGDNPYTYVYRQVQYTYRMIPKVRKHGIRYLFDVQLRKRIKAKQRGGRRFVKYQRTILYKSRGSQCQICHKKFSIEKLTVDHLVKWTDVGYKKLRNLQLLCDPCHAIKDNRVPKK